MADGGCMLKMMMNVCWMTDYDNCGNGDNADVVNNDNERHHQLNVSQRPPLAALHQPKEFSTSTYNGVKGVRITHPLTRVSLV